jgi:hypothetical protein
MPREQAINISETTDGVIFRVKVVPGASRTRIAGAWNGALRVCIAAPPAGGRANAELIRFLGDVLALPRGSVELISGGAQALKRLLVRGQAADRVRSALVNLLSTAG